VNEVDGRGVSTIRTWETWCRRRGLQVREKQVKKNNQFDAGQRSDEGDWGNAVNQNSEVSRTTPKIGAAKRGRKAKTSLKTGVC